MKTKWFFWFNYIIHFQMIQRQMLRRLMSYRTTWHGIHLSTASGPVRVTFVSPHLNNMYSKKKTDIYIKPSLEFME